MGAPADAATVSDIIPLALSDHVSFDQIRALYGRGPDEVQALMRRELKRGSYLAWRKRLRRFSERRETYK
ncbi:DUF2805 domain-containing protein [Aquabacterium sp. A08]|uniref:DUF2805 domain-containing protein n=1 Tax=Aquabacterium sp. A08 TaxID=2718532 RepID=UPI001422B8BB|nr:DUF2805 domain-containing protein [Aquabacterium sp. A08]NIC41280.1 TIGR03643 family protein [Aquabacterium sp. A08]